MASRFVAALAVLGLAAAASPAAEDGGKLEHMVQQDCGSCHGLTMRGGLGRPLTREALEGLDPKSIAAIILDGVPGTAMPPWRPVLREDEALWIADYLMKGMKR
jgi:cytochrome c55X